MQVPPGTIQFDAGNNSRASLLQSPCSLYASPDRLQQVRANCHLHKSPTHQPSSLILKRVRAGWSTTGSFRIPTAACLDLKHDRRDWQYAGSPILDTFHTGLFHPNTTGEMGVDFLWDGVRVGGQGRMASVTEANRTRNPIHNSSTWLSQQGWEWNNRKEVRR